MAKYDINIRDYWRIIRKRRTIVVLATVLCTIFSYLFALFLTPDPVYKATSAVKVERTTDLTTLLLGTVSWNSWNVVSTQAAIINSFPVMERTAKQMGLIPENVSSAHVRTTDNYLRVVTALKAQVDTEQQENTNIINITATSAKAKEAALLANTVAEVFRENNIEERNKRVRETREFIEKQLAVVENRLQQAEDKLRDFEENTKLVAIDAQTKVALGRLTELENQAAQLTQRRHEAKTQLRLLQQFGQGKEVSEEAFYMDNPPPQLAMLTGKLADLRLRRETLLNDYTAEHPEVMETDAELQTVLSEMDKELKSMSAAIDSQLRSLERRLQQTRAQTMTIPESALALARLHRDVDVNAELLSELKSKYQDVMIQESGLIEEVKIVKPALVPTSPINMPNTAMNTLTGGLIGLVLGLVLALIVETMDTSLGTIEDVEEILGIPVLGVIPSTEEFSFKDKGEDLAKFKSEPLVTHFAPRSPVSESYRSLRTNLQFIRMDRKAKIFLVTSSSLQEGKTYNVVNLSLSLAQAGEKVLLIDADLRRPVVHRIFGLERQPGLTDYIMGVSDVQLGRPNGFEIDMTNLSEPGNGNSSWHEVTNTITDLMLGDFEIEDILRSPGLDNLHIISAGQGLLNPAEILRSPRFKEFLNEVREFYDVIIVDTPPVLPVADAFEVAPEVDGVVLVYEVGRIGRGILKRAKVQLESVRANVLGVILNNVKPEVAPDFYRYRTDYYYEEKSDDHSSGPPSRWRHLVGRGLNGIRGRFTKARLTKTSEEKQFNTLFLLLLICLVLVSGLLWKYYPDLRSGSTNSPNPRAEAMTSPNGSEPSTGVSGKSNSRPVARTVDIRQELQSSEPEQSDFKAVAMVGELSKTTMSAPPLAAEEPKSSEMRDGLSSSPSDVEIYQSLPQMAKIRSGPSTNSLMLQRIPQGTRLKVVGQEGNWLKLKLRNGGTGWIFHTLAESVGLSTAPLLSQEAAGSSPVFEQDRVSRRSLVER